MIHAWLCIEPAPKTQDEERVGGCGVQRKFSGESYEDIWAQMAKALEAIGADPANMEVERSTNTSGTLHPIDPPYWYEKDEPAGDVNSSGLEWYVYPCYADGRNVDVDPCEPVGE